LRSYYPTTIQTYRNKSNSAKRTEQLPDGKVAKWTQVTSREVRGPILKSLVFLETTSQLAVWQLL